MCPFLEPNTKGGTPAIWPSICNQPASQRKGDTFGDGSFSVSSLAHSISRSSKRGRIIGLHLVTIFTVLCAQKISSHRGISENCTISSHRVSPLTPPVICCRPFESNLTLKISGFHHMSLPTTATISRRVTSPRVCNSLYEVPKICTLSRGTPKLHGQSFESET